MQFFQLKNLNDTKITGKYPSRFISRDISMIYDRNAPNSFHRVNRNKPFPNNLIIPPYEMHRWAKRLDNISTNITFSAFISKKALEIFRKVNIPTYQAFPIHVVHKGEKLDYYLFYIPEFSPQFVDYQKSSFIKTRIAKRIEPIKINSEEEYMNKYNQLDRPFGIKAEKLFFKQQGIEIDMFRIIKPASGYFVSERLKNMMKEEQIIGFEFIPEYKVFSVR